MLNIHCGVVAFKVKLFGFGCCCGCLVSFFACVCVSS